MHNHISLLPILENYFEKDPVVAAHSLETMDSGEALQLLSSMPASMAAKIGSVPPVSRHRARIVSTETLMASAGW